MWTDRPSEGRGSPARPVVDAGARPEAEAAGRFRTTRLEQALEWAAARAPAPWPVLGGCCGMAFAQGGDSLELLGTSPPPVSSRAADLLIVSGSLTRRQAPLIRAVYDRMVEPRWVVAWGVCAISGGAYDNYATLPGLDRIVPVDVVVPGCPPPPAALREALLLLRSGRLRDPRRGAGPARVGEPDGPARAVGSSAASEWPILRGIGASAPGTDPAALDTAEGPETDEGREDVDRG